MPFVYKSFFSNGLHPVWKEIASSYNLSRDEVLRMIDKKQVKTGDKPLLQKSASFCGEIGFFIFEPIKLNNLEPIYITDDFVVYDKPSGLLVHPNKHDDTPSLLDSIKYQFGNDANIVHRIDRETSGIVVASRNKDAERKLKKLFRDQDIIKEYKAIVRGKIDHSFLIDAPISLNENGTIRVKSSISSDGLSSQTYVEGVKYYENFDATYVALYPKTGRQHQLRVHMFHVKHPIVGDPLYGIDEEFSDLYLKKEISDTQRSKTTGAKRVLLHAHKISFMYNEISYKLETSDPEKMILNDITLF